MLSISVPLIFTVHAYLIQSQVYGFSNGNNLASPSTIITKLSTLAKTTSERRKDACSNDLPWHRFPKCFMESVNLSGKIRRRNSRGTTVKKSEVQELRSLLDFADWAYVDSTNDLTEKLKHNNYQLNRHVRSNQPGRVGHYISLNHDEKVCLIGLKGTSTFSDVLTDLMMMPCSHTLENSFDEKAYGKKVIHCHEGIFTAAQSLADDTEDFLRRSVLPHGYKIMIVGHSLGGGTASILGLLLRSRIAELRNDAEKIHVVAFSPPAVLNHDASVACDSFTTSVVNDSDIVPRIRAQNFVILSKLMVEIQKKLDVKNQYNLNDDDLLSNDELDAFYRQAHAEEVLNEDLSVPGRVVMIFKHGVGNEASKERGKEAAIGAFVTNGGSRMLRQIETTRNMMNDHMTKGIAENMEGLMRRMPSERQPSSASRADRLGAWQ